MKRSVLACALLITSAGAAAQIYECTDAQGNKEFAQACPPGTVQQVQKSGGAATSPASPAPASKSLAEQEAEFRKRVLEKKEAETKAEQEEKKAQQTENNCNDSRSRLKALQEGLRITRVDPNTGERSFLDDSTRQAEIVKAQQAVDSWCK